MEQTAAELDAMVPDRSQKIYTTTSFEMAGFVGCVSGPLCTCSTGCTCLTRYMHVCPSGYQSWHGDSLFLSLSRLKCVALSLQQAHTIHAYMYTQR
eukprot:8211819-Pyramimonas_sp.AAC.1